MALVFREFHTTSDAEVLNQEWLLLENTGEAAVQVQGCGVLRARSVNERPRSLCTIDPGFVLEPKESVRLVSGSPSKKAQGKAPDEKGTRNYHLFLREPLFSKPGVVISVALRQVELAKAVFDPSAKNGIAG